MASSISNGGSMAIIFSDVTVHALGGGRFSLRVDADQPLLFMLHVFRYRITGTTGQLINSTHGDRIDTGNTTLTSLEYTVPAGEKHFFKLAGDIVCAAPAPTWSGNVSIVAQQSAPSKVLVNFGGAKAVTGSDFVPVEVRGGFIVQG
jgi:hypothetical protein